MDEDHWTHRMFVEKPETFLAVHEAGLEYAASQAERLEQILLKAGVPPGGRLLDAPCGIGRHAIHLAERGWRVTGVDLVPAYLERAKALAAERGVEDRLTLRTGDLREVGALLAGAAPFDGVLNIFTSLGYWDDATDRAILRQFHDLTAAAGALVVETINRDFVVRHFQPTSVEEYGDLVNVERRQMDFEASRVRSRWTFYRKEGEDLREEVDVDVSNRVYSPHELRALLEAGGWRKVKVYSGWDLKPLSSDVYRLMAVGRK